ncbi:putative two-component-system connector protein YcgZ (plasmid) [Pantoea sp. Nvir]|mgnify:CR=1 FL=1|uniref:regulatory protein YcgZ n=1 Tax=Pantoea TaxID=53335 RepID=UPI000CDD9EF6|nr:MULTISPECIES: regulatory protein YcgZ [Pantoea]MCG7367522.1 regulatory protein YcgZ [Pantoea sp. ACRSH]MCG7398032.1 regulatory protein YcgZ [Pantoea sp. ACRSC]POW55669.1 two-component-system connector protein YcgZ [Pantoea alvi]UBN52303.1 two-component-system connector protein YcgZ [Pantoea agglomerans]
MRQNVAIADTVRHISTTALPSQQEILGQVVTEILRAGQSLNRKALCSRLIRRLEQATGPEQEQQLHQLIGMLFSR